MGFDIWKSETRSSLRNLDTLLEDVPYVITGGFAVQIYAYFYGDKSFSRETKDIDIIVDKNSKEDVLDRLNKANILYKSEKSRIRDCIRVDDSSDRWYSICFDRLPDWERLEIGKNIYVNVERLESLLVNKFATYLFRGEQKDLYDLKEIVKLLKKRGMNIKAVIRAMKRYNIVDYTEKMFWLYLEHQGLISNAEEYVEFESEEEKKELLYHLKSRFLIDSYKIKV